MESVQQDEQTRHKFVPITGISSTQSLPRHGWLAPLPSAAHQAGQSAELPRGGIRDPKAAWMYKLYAGQTTRFSLAASHPYLLMATWLLVNRLQKGLKRSLDLIIAFCLLPLVLPIMLCAAVIVKLDSRGPVFYHQERVGKWGRRFTCYKFRSMYIDAETRKAELMALNEADEVVFKIKHDPRVTRVGRIIRKLSIDELPQIFNVIKGEMSIVGPRPPVPSEVEEYTFDIYRRLDTIPGITGLQQVSGRSDISFKRWVEWDLEYIRTQSLKKDIEIMFRTIPTVISGKGAY